MPLKLEEYNVGQLYTVACAAKNKIGNNSLAIEILANEPFSNEWGKGQYTHKIFHIDGKLPKFVTSLFPTSATKLDERAWNAFPYCKTQLTNNFLAGRFEITVESIFLPDDRGATDNVFNLSKEISKARQVEILDIANDQVSDSDFSSIYDPRTFWSETAKRGPLDGNWIATHQGPIMCCYKLVTIKFHIFGLEGRVQQYIDKTQRNLFLRINKEIFCTMDQWIGMSVEMIRELETRIQEDLEEEIKSTEPTIDSAVYETISNVSK